MNAPLKPFDPYHNNPLVHRDRRLGLADAEWVRSFACDDMRVLIVCRGPVRKEAIEVFREMGMTYVGMLLSERESIRSDDSTATLHDRLAALGGRLIVEALEAAACGGLVRRSQPAEGVTYAHKIDKAEAAIDWSRPAEEIERRVRAFDPFPGASFQQAGETVKLWRAAVAPQRGAPGTVLSAAEGVLRVACGDLSLDLLQLQRPGGRRVGARDFLAVRSTLQVGATL